MSETNEKIASEIVNSVGRQVDLLITLALAIDGALAAGALQVIFHNSTRDTSRVVFNTEWTVALAFLLEGIAIIFGYFARNSLIYSVREGLFTFDFSGEKKITEIVPKFNEVVRFSQIQYLCFVFGVILLFVFGICNRGLL